jgi:signal-transduction protein with cAMP-binding, CBS, and nucleotidyltransferase domain
MVVVSKDGKAAGVLTKFDIMSHLREKMNMSDTPSKKTEAKLSAKK